MSVYLVLCPVFHLLFSLFSSVVTRVCAVNSINGNARVRTHHTAAEFYSRLPVEWQQQNTRVGYILAPNRGSDHRLPDICSRVNSQSWTSTTLYKLSRGPRSSFFPLLLHSFFLSQRHVHTNMTIHLNTCSHEKSIGKQIPSFMPVSQDSVSKVVFLGTLYI